MNVTVYFVVAIAAAILSLYIKQVRPDFALCITLAAVVILLYGTIPRIVILIHDIQSIAFTDGISSDYISPILKIIGLSYLTEIASNLCCDAGEVTISKYVETIGKISIAFISLPIVEDVFSIILGLLE